jgi:hypothetical protein
MSATGRSDVRIEGDRYNTPEPLAAKLVELLVRDEWVSRRRPVRVLEPHAGTGSFVRALRAQLPNARIRANDVEGNVLRWSRLGADDYRVGDFLAMPTTPVRFDLIAGNPPYLPAESHVRHALEMLAAGGVLAFLLRLGFLESQDRIPFWRSHPPAGLYPLSERPSFVGGGTDQTAYGWFVWENAAASEQRRPFRFEVVSWQ